MIAIILLEQKIISIKHDRPLHKRLFKIIDYRMFNIIGI